MTDQNPYAAPEADLITEDDAQYEPKFLSTKGRIGRLRFFAYSFASQLIFMLFFVAFSFLMGAGFNFEGMANDGKMPVAIMVGMGLLYISLFVFSIILSSRRIHDLNRSAWWLLLLLIPLVNFFLGIYLMLFKGTEGINDYGPAPVANSTSVKAFGMILPLLFLIGILAAVAVPAYQEYQARAAEVQ